MAWRISGHRFSGLLRARRTHRSQLSAPVAFPGDPSERAGVSVARRTSSPGRISAAEDALGRARRRLPWAPVHPCHNWQSMATYSRPRHIQRPRQGRRHRGVLHDSLLGHRPQPTAAPGRPATLGPCRPAPTFIPRTDHRISVVPSLRHCSRRHFRFRFGSVRLLDRQL